MSNQVIIPYSFPEEILLEIFYKLPIKSLGKCMCVCKAWNYLIKSPSFISTRLNSQSSFSSRTINNNLFLVKTCFPGNESEVEYSLHFDDEEFSKYTQLQYPPFDVYHYIVGSCNGLLCLVDFQFYFRFMICNPIIRKCIRLPNPCLFSLPYEFSMGFGFDSRRNDYKVLKITKNDVLDENLQVELYSLKKNSWKMLAPTKYNLYSNDFMIFVNGIVHCIASERVNDHGHGRRKFLLLGFDMGDEVFKETMLPEPLSCLNERPELSVMPYDERSSIAAVHVDCLYGQCNIWVMRTYGLAETWTKMFGFGRIGFEPIPRVVGFRENGGLILRSYSDQQVASHQLEGNEINNLHLRGIYAFVFRFMESLVLLDQVIDARSENDQDNVRTASNWIEEATDDSNDAEDCTSSAPSK